MPAWEANIAVGAAVLLAGIALMLGVIGLISYLRLRHGRLLWIAVAMSILATEGVYLAWLAYGHRSDLAAGGAQEFLWLPLVNLAVVMAVYLAVLKR